MYVIQLITGAIFTFLTGAGIYMAYTGKNNVFYAAAGLFFIIAVSCFALAAVRKRKKRKALEAAMHPQENEGTPVSDEESPSQDDPPIVSDETIADQDLPSAVDEPEIVPEADADAADVKETLPEPDVEVDITETSTEPDAVEENNINPDAESEIVPEAASDESVSNNESIAFSTENQSE